MSGSFYQLSTEEILQKLGSSEAGLENEEVKRRQEQYGPNHLAEEKRTSLWRLFWSQLINPLIIILMAATVLKLFLGSYVEGITIGVTVILMVALAFSQEARAEHSLQALKDLAPLKCHVKRGGHIVEVLSDELVPGDILVLESGDMVPADARLLTVSRFQVSEASLTGESTPISKEVERLTSEVGLADRKNMVHTSSIVSTGRALAVVTATGMQTELGKIAEQIGQIEKEKTPLQKGIAHFTKGMLFVVGALIILFVVVGFLSGMHWLEILLFSVALSVAAIPEGLPAVMTVVLSMGVRLMAEKKALIRKLLAVETLGSTSVICTDKTGTLTLNQLTVTDVLVEDEKDLLEIAALCQDAKKTQEGWQGDPADIALLQWCEEKAGEVTIDHQRISDLPFSSENGLMATLNQFADGTHLLVKGAPEKILEGMDLDSKQRDELLKQAEEMSGRGLKVLAAGRKPFHGASFELSDVQKGLQFCGFFGLIDPPREEAQVAIEKCKQAGIHVAMVTGDHALTAQAIGRQLGLHESEVVVGKELESVSEEELPERVKETEIFARIEPLQKLELVRAYKKLGHTVAMTGDGVNDSPALEAADIGVAMGKEGTDVAKEASDMVLLDDRFATIVDAVEEGRVLFARLRHAITFLLATCFGEVFAILLAFFTIGTPPLEPLQILWINFITGAILSIPLGTEPKIGDELSFPPRDPSVGLIYPGMVFRVTAFSLCLGLGTFGVFLAEDPNSSLFEARSAAFTSVILFEWLMAFQIRSDEKPLLRLGIFKNKNLLIALGIALVLFLLILYIPLFQTAFHTRGLKLQEWGLCILPGLLVFVLEEIRKFIFPKLFSKGKWHKK